MKFSRYIFSVYILLLSSFVYGLGSEKFLVENFENKFPGNKFLLKSDEKSKISVNQSFMAYSGNYSLGISYILYNKSSMLGTYVSVEWSVASYSLAFLFADGVEFYIKGDGTSGEMKIIFIEEDGEKWEYENKKVLLSTDWEKVSVPFKSCRLSKRGRQGDKIFESGNIKSMQIKIFNKNKVHYSGIVYVDNISLTGDREFPIKKAAKEKIREKSNFFQEGAFDSIYYHIPVYREQSGDTYKSWLHGDEWWMYLTLNLGGNFFDNLIQLSGDILFLPKDIGAYYYENNLTSPDYSYINDRPDAPYFLIIGRNLKTVINTKEYIKQIKKITLGNLNINYSPYAIENIDSYMGARIEGDLEKFINYDAFYFKLWNTSYSIGTKLTAHPFGFNIKAVGVEYLQKGVLCETNSLAGTKFTNILEDESGVRTANILRDSVYSIECSRRLYNDKIMISGVYGKYIFKQYGKIAGLYDYWATQGSYDVISYKFYDDKNGNPLFIDETNRVDYAEAKRIGININNFPVDFLSVSFRYEYKGLFYHPVYREFETMSYDEFYPNNKGYIATIALDLPICWIGGEIWSLENVEDKARKELHYKYTIAYWFGGVKLSFAQAYRNWEWSGTDNKYLTVYNWIRVNFFITDRLKFRTMIRFINSYKKATDENYYNAHNFNGRIRYEFNNSSFISVEWEYTMPADLLLYSFVPENNIIIRYHYAFSL